MNKYVSDSNCSIRLTDETAFNSWYYHPSPNDSFVNPFHFASLYIQSYLVVYVFSKKKCNAFFTSDSISNQYSTKSNVSCHEKKSKKRFVTDPMLVWFGHRRWIEPTKHKERPIIINLYKSGSNIKNILFQFRSIKPFCSPVPNRIFFVLKFLNLYAIKNKNIQIITCLQRRRRYQLYSMEGKFPQRKNIRKVKSMFSKHRHFWFYLFLVK